MQRCMPVYKAMIEPIYYRDGNEWSCTREKTKRETKKAMEQCLLMDAKMQTFQ